MTTQWPLENEEYRRPPLGAMQVFLRCYAPFVRFGHGYGGDARGPSTDTRATAKIRWVFTFDIATMTQIDPAPPISSKSMGEGILPRLLALTVASTVSFNADGSVSARARPTASVGVKPAGGNGAGLELRVSLAGANPLIRYAPDIDAHLRLRIFKHGCVLKFSGVLSGDAFPNAEIFLRDAAGDTMLLHTFETTGEPDNGPFEFLPGNNWRDMGRFVRSIETDGMGLLEVDKRQQP